MFLSCMNKRVSNSFSNSFCPCGEDHSESQTWHKDGFKLKTFEIQQMQKKAFLSFPYLTKSNFWERKLP